MSGDRLAEIEERVRTRATRTGNNWAPLANSDVLALVEVAKAARDIPDLDAPETDALYRALARLDSGATEEDA